MAVNHDVRTSKHAHRSKQAPFRLSPIATLVALVAALGSSALHAADAGATPTVEELQAEIARLKNELASARGGTPAATPAPEAAAAAAGATEAATAGAAANQELEKVVVRSKRSKLARVADVPQSVSVVSGQDLANELALDIGAITQRAGNVVKNVGNSRTFSMSIRGVGKVTQTEAQDVSVGFNLDSVPVVYAPLASFNFYDVDAVEVSRGPQGTLSGKNMTVGAININTRNPSFTPDANWAITFGQHATVISQVAGGGPVIDDLLAWRGALSVEKGNGPFANTYNTDQTYFNKDRVSGRVKLLFTPTPDFSALASVEIQPNGGEFYNSGVVWTPVPSNYTKWGTQTKLSGGSTAGSGVDTATKYGRNWFTNQYNGQNFYYSGNYLNTTSPDVNDQQPLYTYTNNASLQLKQRLDSVDLTSITSVRRYRFEARNDEGSPFNISLNGGGKVDLYKQVSEEFRVSSKPGGFVDWQTGVLLWRNQVDYGQDGWSSGWGSDAGAYFASNPQYATLNADAAGRLLMQDSLNDMNKSSTQKIVNKAEGLFGQADWHFTDVFTLTTGARITHEDRTNKGASLIADNGSGGLLNPVSVTNSAGGVVQLGGFNSVAPKYTNGVLQNPTTAGTLGTNTPQQLALADQLAQRYFGVNYSALTQAQLIQVANAKALRQGQIGTLWNQTNGPDFRKNLPGVTLSPSYKINPDQTAYVTWQYGEKGGVSQVINGIPTLAKPEKASALEAGLKSNLLEKTLILNADVFRSIIHNYQQTVADIDPSSPANAPTSITYLANAPQVNITGLEFDGSYSGIRNLTARFSGSYTLARYKSFDNAPNPVDIVSTAGVRQTLFTSQTGQLLPGASRLSLNVGAEYRQPIYNDQVFHASFNTAYLSRYNSDANLSIYAWIPAHSNTDASIGWGRRDDKFDVSLIVKNLFRDETPQSISWTSYIPAIPRWYGVQFAGKF